MDMRERLGRACPVCRKTVSECLNAFLNEVNGHDSSVIEFKLNSEGRIDYSGFRPIKEYQGWLKVEIDEYEKYQKFVRPENRNTEEAEKIYRMLEANLIKILWAMSRFDSYTGENWRRRNHWIYLLKREFDKDFNKK